LNGITSLPNIMKIHQAVQKSLVRDTQTQTQTQTHTQRERERESERETHARTHAPTHTHANAKSKQIFLVFVVLEKAYDSVPRKMLWKALEMKSISEPLINTIKEIHNGNRCQIKIGTSLSQAFYTSKGLLQGCCMSPTLFKVFVEAGLNEWSRKCGSMGIQIKNNVCLYHLLFADEQVILAQDGEIQIT